MGAFVLLFSNLKEYLLLLKPLRSGSLTLNAKSKKKTDQPTGTKFCNKNALFMHNLCVQIKKKKYIITKLSSVKIWCFAFFGILGYTYK